MEVVTLGIEELRKAAVLRRLELAHLVTEMDKIGTKSLVQEGIYKQALRFLGEGDVEAEKVVGLWEEFRETIKIQKKGVGV